MALNVGQLFASLTLNSSSFTGGLSAAQNALGAFAGGVASAGARIVQVGEVALDASVKFDTAMNHLVSVAGVARSEFDGVKAKILELAPATGVGPQKLVDAMQLISSVTDDTSQALGVLELAAKASSVGLGEAADIGRALIAVVNNYGAENITAARAADILALAVRDGGAEAHELAPRLANVIPIAAQLGISFEEVAANIATMTKLGTPAAKAVTQLSAVMSALTKPTVAGEKALAKYGLSYEKLSKMAREQGLQTTLAFLTEKLNGNSTALAQIFGRIEAMRNVMGTAGQQAETYAREIDRIHNSHGELGRMLNEVSKTAGLASAKFRASLDVMAISVGDRLAPSMIKMMEAAQPLINMVIALAAAFAALPQPIQTTIIGVVAVTAMFGALIPLIGLGMQAAIGLSLAALGKLLIALSAIPVVGPAVTLAVGGTMTAVGALSVALHTSIPVMWATVTAAGAMATALYVATGAVLALAVGYATYTAAAAAFDASGVTDFFGKTAAYWVGGAQAMHEYDRSQVSMRANATEVGKTLEVNAERVKQLTDRISGATATNQLKELSVALDQLRASGQATPEALAQVRDEALALEESGGKLDANLRKLVVTLEDTGTASGTLGKQQEKLATKMEGDILRASAVHKGAYAQMRADLQATAAARLAEAGTVPRLIELAQRLNAIDAANANKKFISDSLGQDAQSAQLAIDGMAEAFDMASAAGQSFSQDALDSMAKKLIDLETAGGQIPEKFSKIVEHVRAVAATGKELSEFNKFMSDQRAIADSLGPSVQTLTERFLNLGAAIDMQTNGGGFEGLSDRALLDVLKRLEEMKISADATGKSIDGLAEDYETVFRIVNDRGLLAVEKLRQQATVTDHLSDAQKALSNAIGKLNGVKESEIDNIREATAAKIRELNIVLAQDDLNRRLGKSTELLSDEQRQMLNEAIKLWGLAGEAAERYAKKQEQIRGLVSGLEQLQSVLGAVTGLFEQLGGSAESGTGKALALMSDLTSAATGFAQAWASGNIGGMVASAIQGVTGIVKFFQEPAWKKIGREAGRTLGFEVSQGLAETIEDTAQQFNISIGDATLLNLDAAIEESGNTWHQYGVNIMTLMGRIGDSMFPMKAGLEAVETAWQGVREEAEAAGTIGDRLTVQMLQAAQASGHLTEGMKDFLSELAQQAADGAKLIADGIAMMDPRLFQEGAGTWGESAAQYFVYGWNESISENGILATLDTLGDSFLEFYDVIAQSGNESVLALLGPVSEMVEKLGPEGDLRGAVMMMEGMDKVFKSMADSGALNVNSIGQMGESLMGVTTALREGGLSEDAIWTIMVPKIADVVKASREYGFELDANTQELVRQAEAAGYAFAPDSTERLRMSIDALTLAMGGIPPAFDRITAAGSTTADTLEGKFTAASATAVAATSGFVSETADKLAMLVGDTEVTATEMSTTWEATFTDLSEDVGVSTTDIASTIADLQTEVDPSLQLIEDALGDIIGRLEDIPGAADAANSALNGIHINGDGGNGDNGEGGYNKGNTASNGYASASGGASLYQSSYFPSANQIAAALVAASTARRGEEAGVTRVYLDSHEIATAFEEQAWRGGVRIPEAQIIRRGRGRRR